MVTVKDRAVGCLAGLAIGDALGTTVEFSPRGSFDPITDILGGGPFKLQAGQWTDDTSMALCLADSLLARGTLEARDLMDRFVRWWVEGYNSPTGTCFDIGATTRAALDRYRRSGDPMAGSRDARSAGNGSIMRLAPVAIRWFHDPVRAMAMARLQGATTHAAAEAVDACALLADILASAIAGAPKAAALDRPADPAWAPKIQAIARGEWRSKTRAQIRSSGYVVDTLEAALWCTDRAGDFEGAVLLAANLGEDADTVAAVTGQIAGALAGLSGIPGRWLDRLAWRAEIVAKAAGLHDLAETERGWRTPSHDQ